MRTIALETAVSCQWLDKLWISLVLDFRPCDADHEVQGHE